MKLGEQLFDDKSNMDWDTTRQLGRFFIMTICEPTRSVFTCRGCCGKILSGESVYTYESYMPRYHIDCYNTIHNDIINQLKNNRNIVMEGLRC